MIYTELFHNMHPGFFQKEYICNIPKEWIYAELVMDLRGELPKVPPLSYPTGITFGEYQGEIEALKEAVRRVDEDWVQYFNEGGRFFCAFDGESIVAFCDLSDMGRFQGLHIGGPGCVGTIPEYRKQGIGLELVRRATEIFKKEGYDLSWIHYTHLEKWYMKLGYRPVLHWNCKGILCNEEYEIIPLPKEEWKGVPVPIRYTTEEYYDLETSTSSDGFQVQMIKKRFETPVTHTPEEYDFPDSLYQDHWEKAEAFGIVSEKDGKKELLACIELCPEEWSNRLMVTELWVADELHRQGVGTRLMNLAKEQAKLQGRRAIILETQSCNVRAIAFYLSQGFRLIGYDSCCYTNLDVERHEIRFDFGYFLHKNGGRYES